MKPSGAFLPRFSFLCFFLSLVLTPPAWGEFTHIVKKGESLSSIASKYRLSVLRIQEANDLEETGLQIGKRLIIPNQPSKIKGPSIRNIAPKSNSPETAGLDREAHVVRKGEALARIAQRYNLQVEGLQEINQLKGTILKTGRVLRLKGEGGEQEELEAEIGESNQEKFLAQAEIPEVQALESEVPGIDKDNNSLVQIAQSFLGVKYRRGGNSLVHGLDCSAYVQKVFRVVGLDLPRTAREQFGVGLEVARDTLRLGDLVFFKPNKGRRPAHVGIYIGNDQFIHTSLTKRKVRIDSLNTRYFSSRFIGGRRIEEVKKQPDTERPNIEYPNSLETNFEPTTTL